MKRPRRAKSDAIAAESVPSDLTSVDLPVVVADAAVPEEAPVAPRKKRAEKPARVPSKRRSRIVAGLELRIGYRFNEPKHLDGALTHISAVTGPRDPASSYQRLEFLGDHVLGLAVSDMLYRAFPKASEGDLSRRLSDLVRKETCADVARAIDIGSALKLGTFEVLAGGRLRPTILGDVCEAVIGAVYVDGGYAAAAELVERLWGDRMRKAERPPRDPKTMLQEWAQARGLRPPVYREVERTGPHHDPEFRIAVELPDRPPAEGRGRSKRAAEQAAAAAILDREGVKYA